MTNLKRNIFANLAGRIGNLALVVGFYPIYLRLLGPESLGLIGVFNTLFSVLSLMDLGVSGTVLRETARLSATPGEVRQQRDLLRTTEVYYGLGAGLLSLILIVAAPLIADHLHRSSSLSAASVRICISLMSGTIALQLLLGLYQNALNGLERQSTSNVLIVGTAVVRAILTILTLFYLSDTVEAFFLCQFAVTAASIPLACYFTWHHMPKSDEPPKVRVQMLMDTWRYSGTLAVNGLVGVILTQMDKVVVASLFPLRILGYYTLANTATSLFWAIIGPVNTALFPRFAILKQQEANDDLRRLFHDASQFMVFIIVPPAVLLIFFSREIVQLWTGDPITARESAVLVSLMVMGVAINGITSVSAYAQSALGFPHYVLISNLAALAVLPASMVPLAKVFGAAGPAFVSILLNSLNLIIPPYMFHRRNLREERWHWYIVDMGLPTIAGLAMGGFLLFLVHFPAGKVAQITTLMLMGIAIALAVGAAAPNVRNFLLQRIRYRRSAAAKT